MEKQTDSTDENTGSLTPIFCEKRGLTMQSVVPVFQGGGLCGIDGKTGSIPRSHLWFRAKFRNLGMNDIVRFSNIHNFVLFADDTNVSFPTHDLNLLTHTLNYTIQHTTATCMHSTCICICSIPVCQ